jgi:hypothetical protein
MLPTGNIGQESRKFRAVKNKGRIARPDGPAACCRSATCPREALETAPEPPIARISQNAHMPALASNRDRAAPARALAWDLQHQRAAREKPSAFARKGLRSAIGQRFSHASAPPSLSRRRFFPNAGEAGTRQPPASPVPPSPQSAFPPRVLPVGARTPSREPRQGGRGLQVAALTLRMTWRMR